MSTLLLYGSYATLADLGGHGGAFALLALPYRGACPDPRGFLVAIHGELYVGGTDRDYPDAHHGEVGPVQAVPTSCNTSRPRITDVEGPGNDLAP
jgi:hypothetical protein